jgi:hypothetical protein
MIPRRCRKDRGITVLDQKRRSSQSEPETVSAETETQPQQPANGGLLGRLGENRRFERLRGGPGRSTSGEQRQRLTARCGRFGPIDAQKEFSTMPAPPSARHKKKGARLRAEFEGMRAAVERVA